MASTTSLGFGQAQGLDVDGRDDGGSWLFAELTGDPADYQRFAEEYYEVDVDPAALAHVFAHLPLDATVVQRLNPGVTLDDLREDLATIGYPNS